MYKDYLSTYIDIVNQSTFTEIKQLTKSIASNLLALREHRNIKQKEMAELSEMSQANYSDIERGKTKPSIDALLRFAQILNVSVDLLIDIDFALAKAAREKESVSSSVAELIAEKDKRIEFLERLVLTLAKQNILPTTEYKSGLWGLDTDKMNFSSAPKIDGSQAEIYVSERENPPTI